MLEIDDYRHFNFEGIRITILDPEQPFSDGQFIGDVGKECVIFEHKEDPAKRFEAQRVEFSPEMI